MYSTRIAYHYYILHTPRQTQLKTEETAFKSLVKEIFEKRKGRSGTHKVEKYEGSENIDTILLSNAFDTFLNPTVIPPFSFFTVTKVRNILPLNSMIFEMLQSYTANLHNQPFYMTMLLQNLCSLQERQLSLELL